MSPRSTTLRMATLTTTPAPTSAVVVVITSLALLSGCTGTPGAATSSGPAHKTVAATNAPASTPSTIAAEQVVAAVERIYQDADQPPTTPPAAWAGLPTSVGTPTNEDAPWRVQVLSIRTIPSTPVPTASSAPAPAAPSNPSARPAARVVVHLAITSADRGTHPTRGQYPFNAARTTRDLFAGFAPLRLTDPTTGWFAHPVRLRANAGSADFDETLATAIPTTISTRPFVADLTFPAPGHTTAARLTLQLPGMPDIPGLVAQQ